MSAVDYIQQQQRRYEELTARSTAAMVDPLTLTTQRLAAEEALRGTNFEMLRLSLPEILGTRAFDAAQLEQMTAGHAAGVSDLARALGPVIPAPAYLAWSEHLRTAALPTLSCLAQEWTTPFGLMLEGPAALQASIAWKVRRDESSIHMAAVTPQAEIGDSPCFPVAPSRKARGRRCGCPPLAQALACGGGAGIGAEWHCSGRV